MACSEVDAEMLGADELQVFTDVIQLVMQGRECESTVFDRRYGCGQPDFAVALQEHGAAAALARGLGPTCRAKEDVFGSLRPAGTTEARKRSEDCSCEPCTALWSST